MLIGAYPDRECDSHETEAKREWIMIVKIEIVLLFLMVFVSFADAQEDEILKVDDMVFCTGIENRVPIEGGREFPNTVGKVYCFTKITGAVDATAIDHVWYYNDEEKARVTLPVVSGSWRTWSSKNMLEGWTGRWRVDVLTPEGKLLRSSEFLIEAEVKEEVEGKAKEESEEE